LRFFIDECLSPLFAQRLWKLGHDAVHPLHIGRRGQRDDTIRDICIADDRVIVTANNIDFRSLLSREPIHPGLIALPQVDRETGWQIILSALAYLEMLSDDPMRLMAGKGIEYDTAGKPSLKPLP